MQLKLLLIASGAALGLATPAAAQMDHSNMPGMKMPPPKTPAVKKPAAKKPAATKPAARKKSVKPAAKSTPRAKAGSGAKPAASRSAKPPAPGAVVADPHAGHDYAWSQPQSWCRARHVGDARYLRRCRPRPARCHAGHGPWFGRYARHGRSRHGKHASFGDRHDNGRDQPAGRQRSAAAHPDGSGRRPSLLCPRHGAFAAASAVDARRPEFLAGHI